MWMNAKYRKGLWKGSYSKTKKGERFFILTFQGKTKADVEKIERVYESWQAAKADGWEKCPR
jgi:hypothetical protein